MAILKNLIRRVVLTNHAGTIWFKNDIIAKISISQNYELWRSTQDNIQTYFRVLTTHYFGIYWWMPFLNQIVPECKGVLLIYLSRFLTFLWKKSQGVNFAESAIAIYQHHNKHHFASSHHQKCQSSYI